MRLNESFRPTCVRLTPKAWELAGILIFYIYRQKRLKTDTLYNSTLISIERSAREALCPSCQGWQIKFPLETSGCIDVSSLEFTLKCHGQLHLCIWRKQLSAIPVCLSESWHHLHTLLLISIIIYIYTIMPTSHQTNYTVLIQDNDSNTWNRDCTTLRQLLNTLVHM